LATDNENRPESPVYSKTAAELPPGTNPSMQIATYDMDVAGRSHEDEEDEAGEIEEVEEPRLSDSWMRMKAQEIYQTSTDYMEANITQRWEKNLSHFNNQHAPGSNYRKSSWKRSRVFRPKTRSNIKSQEAGLAAAAFSTKNLVDIQPVDKTNEDQVISARINKAILEYRLKKTVPWFLTAIGAYQDTKNYGICISHQYWSYEEDKEWKPAFNEDGTLVTDIDPETGFAVPMGEDEVSVKDDTLHCDNIPPENFRFDPMCDWRDPVNTSPYLLYMIPMYAGEVMEMMEKEDPKTRKPMWRKYDLNSVLSVTTESYNRTRQAREGRDRIDPTQDQMQNQYKTVWVHMYIVRVDGEDYVYWMLGTELQLTDAIKLTDAFPHLKRGQRPFTLGFSNIEAHKNFPAGDNELASGLQTEINDVANQRLDNVKLVLNKRYFVKRGAQVDLDALIRNVPGGGVMMNEPDKDVVTINTPDVTGSSYQEQDRLSIEMDELVGGFSQSSVQNARNMNETVGGMGLLEQSAGAVEDYSMRVFMETWMEPTLAQMVQLIQYYETDEVVLALAAKEAGVWQKYGMDAVTDDLLRQELTTEVDLAIGNADPARRVQRLIFGVTQTAQLPGMAERIKGPQISDEIFGTLGYKNSSRFFMNDEEFQAYQEENPPGLPPEVQMAQAELEHKQKDSEMRESREQQKLEILREIEYAKLALQENITLAQLRNRLDVEKMRDKTTRDKAAVAESNRAQEIDIKREQSTGA